MRSFASKFHNRNICLYVEGAKNAKAVRYYAIEVTLSVVFEFFLPRRKTFLTQGAKSVACIISQVNPSEPQNIMNVTPSITTHPGPKDAFELRRSKPVNDK